MKFSKNFLINSLLDRSATIEDNIIDHSRWSVSHRRIFKHEEKFYETCYSVGATETQDESPYEYEGNEIECTEVFPIEKVVIVYE